MANEDQPSYDNNLGARTDVFKPMQANIVAGFILSTLMLVGGAAAVGFPLRAAYLANWNLPAHAQKGMSWLAVGLFCLIGIGLIVGGVILAFYSRGLTSRRVEVCANGFRYCGRRSTDDVFWDDIDCIKETILYERPPLLKGPAKLLLPKIASTSYTVVTTSGKEYGFDGNSIKAIKRFGKLLRQQADRLSLPWKTIETHG
jgi:hypothetical protein